MCMCVYLNTLKRNLATDIHSHLICRATKHERLACQYSLYHPEGRQWPFILQSVIFRKVQKVIAWNVYPSEHIHFVMSNFKCLCFKGGFVTNIRSDIK
jgi:hypothetical protein